jgi:hypothetical protein
MSRFKTHGSREEKGEREGLQHGESQQALSSKHAAPIGACKQRNHRVEPSQILAAFVAVALGLIVAGLR